MGEEGKRERERKLFPHQLPGIAFHQITKCIYTAINLRPRRSRDLQSSCISDRFSSSARRVTVYRKTEAVRVSSAERRRIYEDIVVITDRSFAINLPLRSRYESSSSRIPIVFRKIRIKSTSRFLFFFFFPLPFLSSFFCFFEEKDGVQQSPPQSRRRKIVSM